jgi:hypothetical protein
LTDLRNHLAMMQNGSLQLCSNGIDVTAVEIALTRQIITTFEGILVSLKQRRVDTQ